MIRNLGQVAAIYIGSSAPRNTNLIWLDNTVVPFVFRAYDGSAWSEIATHKWVRAYVDGWLVTLPPRQLADDGDYMLINSNNVNYKITVKDFVKSAVGNPLDFKGVIRVSADFPNPSTLESGDMYVIITSPAGGTVTDPYSGKTFEDSEKIVWDEVTQSWESLGKIDITVDLTTSYSETEVTIHSSAGKETTIQGATDQLAGVMLPGQYSWLQALSNGSIVPGDPSPLTPLTPAHKHNYNDIINRLVSQQGTGESTIDPMSQKATTDALNLKFDKASVLQVSGAATDKVMSQKAVTDALKTLSDDFNNKLTNYLPLAGGTMKGSIRFPAESGIIGNADGTGDTYILRSFNNRLDIGSAALSTRIISNASDLLHHRSDTSYKIWDAYNLPTPASTTDLANYLPLIGGTLTGQLTIKQSVDIKLRLQSTDADNHCIIQAINAQASQLGVFGYAGDKWAIGHNGTYYEIWDKYNLTNPVTYTTNTYNHATLTNKDGQYFTYIKAGTNGLLPHSKATLTSGGSGSLGTSDQSFNAAYINNLHTNKVTFGDAGPYITGSTSATQFLNAEGGVQKVATGGLYVGPSYASNALALVPSNGIYSQGNIRTSGWLTFEDNEWTDTGWAYKDAKGSIKVLSVINETNNKPTSYGSVLQFNSRQGHWCTQIWCDQTNAAGVIGTLRFRTTKSYASTEWNPWTSLVTEFDLNSYLTKTEASTLYYPYNGRGYLSITSTGRPVMSNNQGYAVKDKDGNEREVLWMGTNNTLNLGNTSQYTLNKLDLRCTTLTHNGSSIATQNYVTNQLSNYLPLTGGTLSGNLTINTVGSTTFVINNNDTNGSETFMRVLRKGTASAAIGFRDSLGAYIYNYNSNKYLFIDNDGYARVGTTSGSTRLALITDIPTVSGYLPLSGGTLTGTLKINSGGSEPLVINNSASAGEAYVVTKTQGTTRGVMGWNSSLGMFLQDSRGYTFSMKADGVYFGASSSTLTKLPTSTDLSGYLPLAGGTLSGNLTINTVGSTTFVINNNDTNGSETFMRVLRKGTASAAIGFRDSLGAYIYNYNSNKYLFIDNDGYARVGTTSGSTRLALITDIPTVSGYLPLSGGTLTGTLKINSGGSEPLVINNSASAGEAYVVTKTQGTTRGVMGWNSSLGMFLQDSRGYTFSMKADGVYFGASSSTLTKLPTSTDLSGYLPLAGGTLTGALTMSSRRHGVVIDVIGGAGNTWGEGVGALSVQVPNDAGQTPLLLARRSGAAIDTTTAAERLLSMELLDNGHFFIIGMSGSKALQLNWTSGKAGTGKLFGKTIATTDQIPSIPSISISNSGTGNAVTSITANGHTLTVTKGATYLTSHQTIYNLTFQAGTFSAKTFDPNGAAATVNIPTNTSHLTNDSGFITSSALNGYATQSWVNSQNFVKSTSTKKVTDIQPVDALPATQVSGVLYLVFG